MAAKKSPTLFTKWCKGCGICVEFCPRGVLSIENEKALLSKPELCIACGMCEKLCPDYAIYFEKEGESKK